MLRVEIVHNFIHVYIYYIRNKVLYFNSHGNVNADTEISLLAVFSVINVLIRGAEKKNKAVARRATKIRSSSTLYKPDQHAESGTECSCFATLIYY